MIPTIHQILEIEKFFNEINIPTVVKLDQASTQTNAPRFVQENIELLKSNALNAVAAGLCYSRLQALKAAILDPIKA
ncbi:DUF6965 family protein [Niabella hibiscisoli]|uniref:DUF6965 family protein n=1 Tax=Niabella hibiscisoli TaxID=1825928 RepID=UPI001F1030F9|nr:hypothetical protein [Niabella hibiscisoli]MCH5718522.1 hypothetical protein [Niabella hibiscisoli]